MTTPIFPRNFEIPSFGTVFKCKVMSQLVKIKCTTLESLLLNLLSPKLTFWLVEHICKTAHFCSDRCCSSIGGMHLAPTRCQALYWLLKKLLWTRQPESCPPGVHNLVSTTSRNLGQSRANKPIEGYMKPRIWWLLNIFFYLMKLICQQTLMLFFIF